VHRIKTPTILTCLHFTHKDRDRELVNRHVKHKSFTNKAAAFSVTSADLVLRSLTVKHLACSVVQWQATLSCYHGDHYL